MLQQISKEEYFSQKISRRSSIINMGFSERLRQLEGSLMSRNRVSRWSAPAQRKCVFLKKRTDKLEQRRLIGEIYIFIVVLVIFEFQYSRMDYQRLYEQLPKHPVKWTVNDIEVWLKFVGLSNLYPKFKELSIDGSCINSLTQEDLRDELLIQSGIIIKKIMSWVNRGLKEYTSFVENKEAAGFPEMREITQKPQINLPFTSLQAKSSFKGATNKNIPGLMNLNIEQKQPEKEMVVEEPNSMVDEEEEEEEENKKKEYELIIHQSDGPQTSFFSVKEEGAKIGRHSSNQILILDESISRYHAQIKFENGVFFLKDVGSTTGTFIKIEDRKPIYHNMVIEMGSNQFQGSLINGSLALTIIEGPAHSMVIDIPKTGKITIGRKPNNLINFADDQHLSNIHATISYSDGKFYIEDMGTTNGTWERLSMEGEQSDLFEIRDKTVFKIGSNQTYVCKIKMALVSQRTHPNACVICCDQDKDCVYLPCKHNTACIKCSKNLKQCPICRVKIEDFVRIYKS